MFKGKTGLEIGGPSRMFTWKGQVPLYNVVNQVDGCNFSSSTLWESELQHNGQMKYKNRVLGRQFIGEASNLNMIEDETYDFILSCHSLEHMANPLKALGEWLRVLKNGGHMLLILPNKEFTFDYKRPTTTFEHILQDYKEDMGEDDLTHLDEILELHDFEMHDPFGDKEAFRERSLKNYENRAMHHHVFDLALLHEICSYLKLNVIASVEKDSLFVLGEKPARNT